MDVSKHRLPIWAGWDTYRVLLPSDAPDIQVLETRRAFYGGAMMLLNALLEGSVVGGDTLVVELTTIRMLQAEIEGFVDAVDAGRA